MTSRERNMLIALGIIAIGGLAYLFLFVLGGDEPAEETAPTPPVTSPPPVPAEPGTGVGEPDAEPPRVVTFFGGRDPFVPLVVPAEAGEATDGDATDGDGDGDATDGDGDGDGDFTDGDPPVEPPDDDAEGEGISVTGRQVVLIDVIDEDTVQVEVDGETYTVDVGETFSRNFELVSVTGSCARFLFGDESFTLCEGDAQK